LEQFGSGMCEESLHPGDAASKLSIEARATRLFP
jgi:hypothetical protein